MAFAHSFPIDGAKPQDDDAISSEYPSPFDLTAAKAGARMTGATTTGPRARGRNGNNLPRRAPIRVGGVNGRVGRIAVLGSQAEGDPKDVLSSATVPPTTRHDYTHSGADRARECSKTRTPVRRGAWAPDGREDLGDLGVPTDAGAHADLETKTEWQALSGR
jgi:hypothetical protein